MNSDEVSEPQSSSTRQRLIALLVGILVIVAVLVTMLYLVLTAPVRLTERALQRATEKHEKSDDLGNIVIRVRGLARLETVDMRVMHVGRIRQSYGVIPSQLAGDTITFLAVGDVVAGIDLSSITREDVRREKDGTLVMKLPPSEIFMTRLDNKESHVIDRDTGILRRADPELETKVRQQGEDAIHVAALRKGVLPIAQKNAETRLGEFLHSLGFQKVRFERRLVTVEP